MCDNETGSQESEKKNIRIFVSRFYCDSKNEAIQTKHLHNDTKNVNQNASKHTVPSAK